MELRSSGGALRACRRADVEVWRLGALAACWTCRDVEEEAERYRGSGDVLQACGRGDVDVWRSELWRHAASV